MAGRKQRGKSGKKTSRPSKKPPIWLRDLLNLLAGLLVGSLCVWLFQEYRENRAARVGARQYVEAVRETQPLLTPMADRYLALAGQPQGEGDPNQSLDVTHPVCSLDPYRDLLQEVCALPRETAALLLEFSRNLQKAEVLRKLLEQERQDPAGLSRTLEGQLLLTVYDESRRAPELLWKLRVSAGKKAEKKEDKAVPESEGP
jgi:hypothetical protein